MVAKGLAQKVRFYVKSIPWFISDVTKPDFDRFLHRFKSSDDEILNQLGKRWSDYVDDGIWSIEEHDFWTLPVDFSRMYEVDPELYKKLAKAKLLVFKGDLNYRKLFGERNWDPTTPVEVALQNFHPSKLCTLRTCKADIVCGLPEGLAEKLSQESDDWKTSGKYGLIQFCGKVSPGVVRDGNVESATGDCLCVS